jgi:hypothetical protein
VAGDLFLGLSIAGSPMRAAAGPQSGNAPDRDPDYSVLLLSLLVDGNSAGRLACDTVLYL